MRRRFFGVVAAAGLVGFIGAAPALAHQGHAGCAEGTHSFIVPLAHSGLGGETASMLARAGMLDESVAAGHAALCEPKP